MAGYLEFEVSLKYLKPRIWRRFLLDERASLLHLHKAIQAAFGWQDYHLFEFQTAGRRRQTIAVSGGGGGWQDEPQPDAKDLVLSDVFAELTACLYVYDFGDDWEHEVKVRKRVEVDEAFHRRLLAGARSGPPEDCGGFPGYDRLVAFLETGQDPWEDEDGLRDWIGGWSPDGFNLDEVKARFDSNTQGRRAVPRQIALPEGSNPRHIEVAELLVEKMNARGWSRDKIVQGETMWAEYVKQASPKPRKAAIYAASVEYCVARVGYYDLTQGELAATYGTSVISISKTWRAIWDTLGLEENVHGDWQPASQQPLSAFEKMIFTQLIHAQPNLAEQLTRLAQLPPEQQEIEAKEMVQAIREKLMAERLGQSED